jgi:hypothetical protein
MQTLARTTDVSNAPKPEIENIQGADFTPDGSALAIVRYVPAESPVRWRAAVKNRPRSSW